tara:strand:+ start:434 stop:1366 length:933 start_codon:yes stop_codon:yes gene_type:complete
MSYIGNIPAESYASFERQVFTIVNSQTAYTLSHSVVNENDIRLVVNNVVQEPGSGKAYTASGTTLTLSAALVNGTDEMYCVFLGRALQTVNPPNASVGADQLASSAVTTAKINANAVDNTKVASTIITGQTAESTIADADTILIHDASASALRKMTKANFVSGVGETNAPYFLATQSSSQSVSNSTVTKIVYDSVTYNVGGGTYDTSNSRFTPGVAGRYFISAWVFIKYAVNPQQRIDMKIAKNGTNVIETRWIAGDNLDGSASAFVQGIVTLGTTDYIEAFMFQTSGASRSMDNNAAYTFFNGFKIANT